MTVGLERPAFRTPRSAGYAGIVFSFLFVGSLLAVHFALPEHPSSSLDLLTTSPRRELLLIGLSLIPFAAIAFLWFIGVLRDRIGEREDRFFSTVFFGGGLLFVAVLLVAEAMASGVVLSIHPSETQTLAAVTPDWWEVTRNISLEMVEAALQMAGVFTTAAAALLLRTKAAPRWLGISGAVISTVLIVGAFFTQWIGLLFPAWVFALSLDILITARRAEMNADPSSVSARA